MTATTTTSSSEHKYIRYRGHDILIRKSDYEGDIAYGAYYGGNWVTGGPSMEKAETEIKKTIDGALSCGGSLYTGGR